MSFSAKVKACQETLNSFDTFVNNTVSSLNGSWEGAAYNRFTSDFSEIKNIISTAHSHLTIYSAVAVLAEALELIIDRLKKLKAYRATLDEPDLQLDAEITKLEKEKEEKIKLAKNLLNSISAENAASGINLLDGLINIDSSMGTNVTMGVALETANTIINSNIVNDTKEMFDYKLYSLSFDELFCAGTAVAPAGISFATEPDPSIAINHWASKGIIKSSDFVYPKDSKTGKSLGAWPKNYAEIPTNINVEKVYANSLIWPTTPTNGNYEHVYMHNGIDISSNFGEPIYSPASGTIMYSEWGHTVNKGSDETAYSVTLKLDNPLIYNGKSYDRVFLTHLSGLRYRLDETTNQRVEQGELLGFMGNAAGSATSPGYAPHLHMTIYNSNSGYDSGMSTSTIEDLYNINNNQNIKAGE